MKKGTKPDVYDTFIERLKNFEKELHEHLNECLDVKFPTTDIELIRKDVEYTARKFYELGLNHGHSYNYK